MSTQRNQSNIGTRTDIRREKQPESGGLTREELEQWIASAKIAEMDTTVLPDIPERPGLKQRWVRVMLEGKPDVANISKRSIAGWKPRPASTAPGYEAYQIGDGEYAGYIGYNDMVLMERPKELQDQKEEIERRKTNAVEMSIRKFQEDFSPGSVDARYAMHEAPELRSRVEVGRKPVDIPD